MTQGAEIDKTSKTCHFGRKPRKGGNPAKDKKERDKIVFCGGERVVREIIFVEVRVWEVREEMIVRVVSV